MLNKNIAPVILRYGLSLVFIWFGINQLLNPSNFLGYLPNFIFSSDYASTFVIINGLFEIILSLFLIAGKFTRIVAFILSLHLIGIIFELGYGEVAIRDFGLLVATLSIMFYGPDSLSMDKRRRKK
jgi:uncharacterized membrane protein YphA (DoxX/SURF4 family)